MKYIPLLFVGILAGCSSDSDERLIISEIDFKSEAIRDCINSAASEQESTYADEITEFYCYADSYNTTPSNSTEDLLLFPNIMTIKLSSLDSGFIDSNHFKQIIKFTLSTSTMELINIDGLVNLQELVLSQNDELKNINLTYNTKIKKIYIYQTPLEALNIETLTELEKLQFLNYEEINSLPTPTSEGGMYRNTWGDITHINFDNNINLKELSIIGNQLSSLSLTNHPKLSMVEVTDSNIQGVELDLPALKTLSLFNNSLSNIDLSYSPNLTELTLSSNMLTNIDLSYSVNLTNLNLWNNSIKSIELSNNLKLNYANLKDNSLTEETIGYLESIDWIDTLGF